MERLLKTNHNNSHAGHDDLERSGWGLEHGIDDKNWTNYIANIIKQQGRREEQDTKIGKHDHLNIFDKQRG